MIGAYQTDKIKRHIGGTLDEWNERGSGKAEEIRAHVVYQTKLVYSLSGEEVSSPIQILLKPDQLIDHKDRIELENEDFSHPIINIHNRRHLSVEFKEVFLEGGK